MEGKKLQADGGDHAHTSGEMKTSSYGGRERFSSGANGNLEK